MLLIEWKKITEKDNFKCETCSEIKNEQNTESEINVQICY